MTVEQQLLAQAERQTKALESIRSVLIWSVTAVAACVALGLFYLLAVSHG